MMQLCVQALGGTVLVGVFLIECLLGASDQWFKKNSHTCSQAKSRDQTVCVCVRAHMHAHTGYHVERKILITHEDH